MIFNSNKFFFNGIHSKDINIHLVSEDSGVLNDYGIPFNIENENEEIVLSFCHANEDIPLEWDCETTIDFLEWVITEDYCEFISEDNKDIIYFLKGVGYKKRLTNDMTGIIDVTFKTLSPYGYVHYIKEIDENKKNFEVYNYSNIDNAYKPLITLTNICTNEISLKNATTNKESFTIENLDTIHTVYIDNQVGTITDSRGNNILIKSNRNWIELSKGANIFTLEGECNIKIEAYYPMMV